MSCGKPIGHLWEAYEKEVKGGKSPKKVLDQLGLERYCCRTVFLTHKNLIQKIGKFKK